MKFRLFNKYTLPADFQIRIFIFGFLLLMAMNYLNFSLFGRNELLLGLGRLLSSVILLYLILDHQRIQTIIISFLFLALLAFGLSGFDSLIYINIIFIMAFVIASRKIPIKNLIDYCYFICIFSVLIVMISMQLGLTSNSLDEVGDRSRATFGFANTNGFSSLIGATVMLALLRAQWIKASFFYYAFLLLITYYFYSETDNRTLLLSILLYVIVNLFFFMIKSKLVLKFFSFLAVIIPMIIVIMLPYILTIAPAIDFLLSFRISYAVRYMSGFPDWALFFGGPSYGSHATDMGLVLILYNFGAIFVTITMFYLFRCLQIAINLKQHNTCAFLITFWVMGISESAILRPETIIGLVFWLLLLRPKDILSFKS